MDIMGWGDGKTGQEERDGETVGGSVCDTDGGCQILSSFSVASPFLFGLALAKL